MTDLGSYLGSTLTSDSGASHLAPLTGDSQLAPILTFEPESRRPTATSERSASTGIPSTSRPESKSLQEKNAHSWSSVAPADLNHLIRSRESPSRTSRSPIESGLFYLGKATPPKTKRRFPPGYQHPLEVHGSRLDRSRSSRRSGHVLEVTEGSSRTIFMHEDILQNRNADREKKRAVQPHNLPTWAKSDGDLLIPDKVFSPWATCDRRHLLSALGTSRDTGWKCNGASWPGGCRSGITHFWQTQGMNRFRCGQCDYDLCEKCCRHMMCSENGSASPRAESSGTRTPARVDIDDLVSQSIGGNLTAGECTEFLISTPRTPRAEAIHESNYGKPRVKQPDSSVIPVSWPQASIPTTNTKRTAETYTSI